MFSKTFTLIVASLATVASALPSSADFHAHRHRRNAIPTQFNEARGYAQDADLLEPYDQYHARYILFQCQSKHNTSFWDQCCHPVLKSQNPDTDLPPSCHTADNSGGKGNSSDDGDDCDDGDDDSSNNNDDDGECDDDGSATTTTTTHASAATTTKAPNNGAVSQTSKIVTSTRTSTQATQTSGGGGGSSGSWNGPGFGTYYYQNGNAGACGDKHGDDELIVAIDVERYGDTGKKSSLCGKHVLIKNKDNGKTVTALIADVCPSCVAAPGGQVKNSIDFSVGTFKALESNLGVGQLNIEWKFV